MKSIVKFTLALVPVIGFSLSAQAGVHKFESFINGFEPAAGINQAGQSVALAISNNTTVSYGQSNVTYWVQASPFGYSFGTNQTLATNRYFGPAMWDSMSGQNVFYVSNTSLIVVTNQASTNLSAPALIDVPIVSDANSDPPSVSFQATFTGDSLTASNSLTFTVAKSLDGLNFSSIGNFSFTFTPVAVYVNTAGSTAVYPTNAYTFITNIVSTNLAGVRKLRLLSIASTTNGVGGGTNLYMNACGIGIWTP